MSAQNGVFWQFRQRWWFALFRFHFIGTVLMNTILGKLGLFRIFVFVMMFARSKEIW